MSTLRVIGLVALCDEAPSNPANTRPTTTMSITQYLRLTDESLIRLDMDRGVSSFSPFPSEYVSWKRPADEVIDEVLTLVQGDTDESEFPWEGYAEAARMRGIDIDAESLRGLPYQVFLSDRLTEIYEF